MKKKSDKRIMIKYSTTEFLIFTSQAGEDGIEVRVEDENVWLTQKLIAKLFGVEVNTINYHLKEIFLKRVFLWLITFHVFAKRFIYFNKIMMKTLYLFC
jgi:hypothetical protein